MELESRIVEWVDPNGFRLAYVRKQERDRLRVVDPLGRDFSVLPARIVIVHQAVEESDFAGLARRILERVEALRSEVDVELLWQSLGSQGGEFQAAELARTYFGESGPDRTSAIFRALYEDTLYFRRKGRLFVPRSAEQVSSDRLRRVRQLERERFRERATRLLRDALDTDALPQDSEWAAIVERVYNWLRYGTGDEVGAILGEIAGADWAKEAAYLVLLRSGRVDPSIDRFLVMNGIDPRFPAEVLERAQELSGYVPVPSRLDLVGLPATAIDDEETREVDDALTMTRSGGDIIVGIHIADVSRFVQKGDPLDEEARRRSTSLYLPTATVPMFPERLSTDLASLKVGTARPALTIEVRFDGEGNPIDHRIALSSIRVHQHISYLSADRLIRAGDEVFQVLHEIANRLRLARASRGATAFSRPELKVCVRDGQITIKHVEVNSPARILVSEMMILANSLAAAYASGQDVPIIFRLQEPPESAAAGNESAVGPLDFGRIRKTFKRSRLSVTPGVHWGLGLDAYTQATSPIRRYPDLVTQRQFTAVLRGEALPHRREELLEILTSAEQAEQIGRRTEEMSTTYWILEFLRREQLAEPLSATVVDRKGRVELDDYYVRGKVVDRTELTPGATVPVTIETVEPRRLDIRFRLL